MKLWLALLLALAASLAAAPRPSPEQLATALAEAEQLALAERWPEALKAGEKLRTLCRDLLGEEHADTALADLFLGEVRGHLGDRVLAEAHFRRGLAITEKLFGRDAPELAAPLTRLAANLRQSRRLDEAVGLLERVLAIEARDGENAATADAATNLARTLRAKGEPARSAPLVERAAAIRRRVFGGTAPETIETLAELAQTHEEAGALPAAELAAAEWVAAVDAHFGPASRAAVHATSEWARLAARQRKFDEAATRYRRALAAAETALAAEPAALASLLDVLGETLRQLRQTGDALPHLQRALALRRTALGNEHADTATSAQHLAAAHRELQQFDLARPLYAEALEMREQVLGLNAAPTIEILADLGELEWEAGRLAAAAQHFETRRYRAEEAFGAVSAATATAWQNLAATYESDRRWPQAIQSALRTLELQEKLGGPAATTTLDAMLALARICTAAGAFEPALVQFARLATWFRQHPEAEAPARAELLRQYAVTALRAGRSEDAGALFAEARRVHETAFGPNDPATLRTIADLWTYFDETRQPRRALEVAQELAERTARAQGADAPATADVLERLGQLCLSLGEKTAAARHFRRAAEARRQRHGDGSAEHLATLGRVAGWFEAANDDATAIAWHTERLGAARRTRHAESEEIAAGCGDLAMCYFRQRDYRAARGMFDRQLELLSRQRGADSPPALGAIARLGDVAAAAGDWPAALRERERLAAGCARTFGPEHPEHARALLLLAEAQLASGRPAGRTFTEAHRLLTKSGDATLKARAAAGLARSARRDGNADEARRAAAAALGEAFASEASLGDAFVPLGLELLQAGDRPTAESVLTAALLIFTQSIGDHDERTLQLLHRLGALRLELGRRGAAELFTRAATASAALYGAAAPEVQQATAWLIVAQVNERDFRGARQNAERLSRETSGTKLAALLLAWTRLLAAGPGHFDALAEGARSFWGTFQPVCDLTLAAASSLAHRDDLP